MEKIKHIHPPFWYADMQWSEVQILIHARNVAKYDAQVTGKKVRLKDVVRTENANYLLLYVETKDAKAQTFNILLTDSKAQVVKKIPYELRERTHQHIDTFDAHDVVYLLIPDRWADGTANNPRLKRSRYEGMLDNSWDAYYDHFAVRNGVAGCTTRHGGDLAGMLQHLNYLQDLGVTAIWSTPLLENNNKTFSYHGYTVTNHYLIDPRLGSNEEYCEFVRKANNMGLKVIQDQLFNHCSPNCFLYADKVDKSWFYTDERMERTNFRPYVASDPYASDYDKDKLVKGCFIESPAFNGSNRQVQDYLIQNSLWWIEYSGVNGVRQDTYPYNDLDEMNRWCQAVEAEHPGYNLVGETYMSSPVAISYWQKDSPLDNQHSLLPTVMDFPLRDILNSACDEVTDAFSTGLNRVQKYLADDRIYAHPNRLMTFFSNHDTDRFVRVWDLGDNDFRYKQALTLLLTVRGIPQLYYGDEVSMAGCVDERDWGQRQNFPGGFPGDIIDIFKEHCLTSRMWSYYKFTKLMLNWRKGPVVNKIIAEGRFIHHVVDNGIYVYARELNGKMVTVMLNGTWGERSIQADHYRDVFPQPFICEMLSGRLVSTIDTITMNPRDIFILDWTNNIFFE